MQEKIIQFSWEWRTPVEKGMATAFQGWEIVKYICFQNFCLNNLTRNHSIKQEKLSKHVCSCLFKWEYSKIFWLPGELISMLTDILSSGRREERTKLEPEKSRSISLKLILQSHKYDMLLMEDKLISFLIIWFLFHQCGYFLQCPYLPPKYRHLLIKCGSPAETEKSLPQESK